MIYDIGKVIFLARTARGMSQESLCHGICSARTLSRIENGTCAVSPDFLEPLRKRLGLSVRINTPASCSLPPQWQTLQKCCNNAVKDNNYGEAARILTRMRLLAVEDIRCVQYILVEEAVIKYKLGEIIAGEKCARIDRAIRMTAPDYDKYMDAIFPYTLEECRYFMNLGNGLNQLCPQETEKALTLNRMALRCLEAGYMCGEDVTELHSRLLYNICLDLTDQGMHMESKRRLEELIRLCLDNDNGHTASCALSEIDTIYKKEKENGKRLVEESFRKRSIHKTTYLCMAINNTFLENRMRMKNSDAWE